LLGFLHSAIGNKPSQGFIYQPAYMSTNHTVIFGRCALNIAYFVYNGYIMLLWKYNQKLLKLILIYLPPLYERPRRQTSKTRLKISPRHVSKGVCKGCYNCNPSSPKKQTENFNIGSNFFWKHFQVKNSKRKPRSLKVNGKHDSSNNFFNIKI